MYSTSYKYNVKYYYEIGKVSQKLVRKEAI